MLHFRDEHQQSVINSSLEDTSVQEIKNKSCDGSAINILGVMVETSMETVIPRGLERAHIKQGFPDFLLVDVGVIGNGYLKFGEAIWELGGLTAIEFLLKNIMKILLHQQSRKGYACNPLPLGSTEDFQIVSSLSDKGGCVVELSVPIPRFYPVSSGSLEPH